MADAKRLAEKEVDLQVPLCVSWTVEGVGDWIESLGFPQYRVCFTQNMINGRKLILIDASALPKIGIRDFEDIKIIAKKIRDILEQEEPNSSKSISLPHKDKMGLYLDIKCRTGIETDALTYSSFLERNVKKFKNCWF